MSSFHLVEIDAKEAGASVRDKVVRSGDLEALQGLENYIKGVKSGNFTSCVKLRFNAVKASGTFTFDTVIATDEILINGVTFEAKASGAEGDEFNVGDNDTEAAANAAAAINASGSALVTQHVEASSAGAVLTITAKRAGVSGNAITISSPDTTITASAARLAGGLDGTSKIIERGLTE